MELFFRPPINISWHPSLFYKTQSGPCCPEVFPSKLASQDGINCCPPSPRDSSFPLKGGVAGGQKPESENNRRGEGSGRQESTRHPEGERGCWSVQVKLPRPRRKGATWVLGGSSGAQAGSSRDPRRGQGSVTQWLRAQASRPRRPPTCWCRLMAKEHVHS